MSTGQNSIYKTKLLTNIHKKMDKGQKEPIVPNWYDMIWYEILTFGSYCFKISGVNTKSWSGHWKKNHFWVCWYKLYGQTRCSLWDTGLWLSRGGTFLDFMAGLVLLYLENQGTSALAGVHNTFVSYRGRGFWRLWPILGTNRAMIIFCENCFLNFQGYSYKECNTKMKSSDKIHFMIIFLNLNQTRWLLHWYEHILFFSLSFSFSLDLWISFSSFLAPS